MINRFDTPVLFIVFNRPLQTQQVFERIKVLKPTKLYIAADGFRKLDEEQRCDEVKEIVCKVDWDCEVETLFQKQNLGCGLGPATAIRWFFSKVPYGIILEDDCLPESSFFYFCQDLLRRYEHDERIMHITGTNPLVGQARCENSYYFSNIPGNWGWASWRRAWNFFDYDMKTFPEFKAKKIAYKIFPSHEMADFHVKKYESGFYKHIPGVWDCQWQYAVVTQGLAITPSQNLVKNIGFGENAVHCFVEPPLYKRVTVSQLSFPLIHPNFVVADDEKDLLCFNLWYKTPKKSALDSIRSKAIGSIKKLMDGNSV